MNRKNVALIFAGGTGQRMNSRTLPKQFLEIHGKPIIIYTLEQFDHHPQIDGIIVACISDKIEYLYSLVEKFQISKVVSIVPGGETGQLSIFNALCEASNRYQSDTTVLIHDGVRPLIDQQTISKCITCIQTHGNAITTAPAVETVIISNDNKTSIEAIVQRSRCDLARAPQGFKLGEILTVHKEALEAGINDSIDSATLMSSYGIKLHTVEGPSENIKITTPTDFYTFRGILDARENMQVFG
jgi:2-C-methyl-D-erythritol 4-phosphate cytidylyltransferase